MSPIQIRHRVKQRGIAVGVFLLMMTTIPLLVATAGANVDDDFTKERDRKEWRMRRGNQYGIEVKRAPTDVGFKLSPLTTTKSRYLTLGRPVEVNEGVSYTFSFEARAEKENYAVHIGERASKEDSTTHLIKTMNAPIDFQPHEFEFVAKPPPVAGAKARQKGTKKPKEVNDHQPHISFLLGSASGSFEIKWLKLTQVKQ